jgi:hypothetical protein
MWFHYKILRPPIFAGADETINVKYLRYYQSDQNKTGWQTKGSKDKQPEYCQ